MTTTQSEAPALALRPSPERPTERHGPHVAFDMDAAKEQAMMARPHTSRFVWFFGILLLIGSAVGAGWALSNGSSDPALQLDKSPPPIHGIVSLGIVDNEPRIRQLHPPLGGRVVEVAAEDKTVKKGDVLLRLDSEYAGYQVKKAQAALDHARAELERAKILPKKHEIDIKNQEKAIDAATHKREANRSELEATRAMIKDGNIKQRVLDAVENGFKFLDDLVEIEKNKLSVLQLTQPDLDVNSATSNVAARQAQLDEAKLALERCNLTAPDDGTVLRVFVSPGEWIGSDAKVPAIQFCPTGKRIVRAEVLQEWASLVEKGQKVAIEDDTRAGPHWTGTVTHVSDWITQKRNIVLEPFMVNDVRTLECLIEVQPGGPPLRLGQRVRVTIEPKPTP